MKKSIILMENVRKALMYLYFVSHKFNRMQYEDYVTATHMFLDIYFFPDSFVTAYEKRALDRLSVLVSSFSKELSEYNVPNKFLS